MISLVSYHNVLELSFNSTIFKLRSVLLRQPFIQYILLSLDLFLGISFDFEMDIFSVYLSDLDLQFWKGNQTSSLDSLITPKLSFTVLISI